MFRLERREAFSWPLLEFNRLLASLTNFHSALQLYLDRELSFEQELATTTGLAFVTRIGDARWPPPRGLSRKMTVYEPRRSDGKGRKTIYS